MKTKKYSKSTAILYRVTVVVNIIALALLVRLLATNHFAREKSQIWAMALLLSLSLIPTIRQLKRLKKAY